MSGAGVGASPGAGRRVVVSDGSPEVVGSGDAPLTAEARREVGQGPGRAARFGAGAPRDIRWVSRDGLSMRALDWEGDPARTPLLCLSGICRTAGDYAEVAMRHAGKRRVVALDYVGHGESARAAEVSRYHPRAVIGDVLDACAALHLPRVVAVGTSFGGLVTMFLSLVRPGLLRGALINDIGPVVETDGMGMVSGFAGHDPGFASLEESVPYLRRVMPGMPLPDDAAWLRFAELTYRRGEDERFHPRWDTRIVRAMDSDGEGGAFGDIFGGLRDLPVALVWGEKSDILRWPTVAAMVREKPDLQLIRFPEAGHAPTLTETEIVGEVDGFLDSIP